MQLLRWSERTWVAGILEGNDELIGLKLPGPEWRVRTGVSVEMVEAVVHSHFGFKT